MIGNFVQETANAPGNAATVTLAGPSVGRRGIIAAFGGGATVYLGMEDGTQWQLVEALTVAGPPQQITIISVLSNSAGNTNRLNFAGSVRIYSIIPAERNVYARQDGSVPIAGDLTVSKAEPRLTLNKSAASEVNGIFGQSAGVLRWNIAIGDASNNLALFRHNSSGVFLDAPLIIDQGTGVANFAQRPTHAGVPLASAGGQAFSGDVAIDKASPYLFLNRPNASTIAAIQGRVNGLDRWRVELGNNVAETGGNAGSDFIIARMSDAGAFIDLPLMIFRNTGVVNFAHRPTHAGVQLLTTVTAGTGLNGGGGGTPTLNLNTGLGEVGTYLWSSHNQSGTLNPGSTLAGSNLRNNTRSGTWRLMSNDAIGAAEIGLWMRIS